MTPEEKQKLNEIYEFMIALRSNTTIPYEVGEAFKVRIKDIFPAGIELAPRPAITAPSGGATVDSQSRSAINAIRQTLTELGLTQ